jgi:menaquinone-dependent protoporphyrinogen IX oxidase
MKIGVVYGTRRNAATAEIAAWMTERFTQLGHSVTCAKPESFEDFECDLYVLGTAVYAFSAKRTGLHAFIRTNRERIGAKPVAVFIVCGADPLDEATADNPLKKGLKKLFLDREKYLASVTAPLETAPVATEFFKGYQEPEDREKLDFESQKERVVQWCDSVLDA